MRRNEDFEIHFRQYSEAVLALSAAFDGYANPKPDFTSLGKDLETAADAYFSNGAALIDLMSDVERDAERTQVLMALIATDMTVMSQSALLAWYSNETDENDGEGEFGPAEVADLLPGLEEETVEFLAVIEGTSPRYVVGASESDSSPNRSVAASMHQIFERAGDDVEGALRVSVTMALGPFVIAASELWERFPDAAMRRRLRWVAAKAIEAAREKLARLWEAGDDALQKLVLEFGSDARQSVFKAGLVEGLKRLFDEKKIVLESDMKLLDTSRTTQQILKALLESQRVADEHKRRRGWVPKAILGCRALALIQDPVVLPWKMLATLILVTYSVWLAAAYAGSERLPRPLRVGIRGIPDVVDASLGLPDFEARAGLAERDAAFERALEDGFNKSVEDARGTARLPRSSEQTAEALVKKKLGSSADELHERLCEMVGLQPGATAGQLLLALADTLEMRADDPIEAIVDRGIDRLHWGVRSGQGR
jgi:hypothetical protein